MLDAITHLIYEVVVPLIGGMTPERPVWLRRLVQAFWGVVVLVFLAAAIYGLFSLIAALT